MEKKRRIEIFTAGCPACEDTIAMVQRIACDSCDVLVFDMNEPTVAERAKTLGVRSVPAVSVNGELLDCCVGKGVDEDALRSAGVGLPL